VMLEEHGGKHSSDELVSVIIPMYNGEQIINETIESVLNQTHKPIELIVIDDASQDNAFEKLAKLNHEKLVAYRIIRHEKNLGLAATLNHGLKESHGEYVAILHQDCVLVDPDWMKKALEYFSDGGKIAIVTGYYGIPPDNLTFAVKAFGIFRRQYHAADASKADTEVTFSEGKCDLFRREALEKIGGFPERFRIAGEDLYVSYKLRQLGYSIVKSYRLPVVQKFGPTADSISKNLKKEFVFGKAMGGIFPMFKTFLFQRIGISQYSKTRSVQRATQPLFVSVFILLLLLALAWSSMLMLYLSIVALGVRHLFYVAAIWSELRHMSNAFHKTTASSFLEAVVIAALGIVIDFTYTFGFCYGLVLYIIGARL